MFLGTPHEIRPLYEVGDELRDALSLQVDSLNEKVNKVNRNIKSASRGLDEAETKLDTIHGEIDQQARCLVGTTKALWVAIFSHILIDEVPTRLNCYERPMQVIRKIYEKNSIYQIQLCV